ncbi:J domain-containing protein, partial [Haematococcus lacustris]
DLSKQLRDVETLQTATHQALAALAAAVASGAVDKVEAWLQALAKLHPLVEYSEAVAAAKACALLAVGKPHKASAACKLGYTAPPSLAKAPWRLWLLTQAQYQLGDMQAALKWATRLASVLQQEVASAGWQSEYEQEAEAFGGNSVHALAGAGLQLPSQEEAALNWADQLANIVQKVGSPGWQSEYEQEAEAFGGNSVQALAGAGLQLPSREEVGCVVSHLTALSALKEEGNAAVKDGNLRLAVDKYSAALALLPPPGYAAVLHCNRAAAHQGLDSLVDALADCGRAKALDPGYARGTTRMASVLL